MHAFLLFCSRLTSFAKNLSQSCPISQSIHEISKSMSTKIRKSPSWGRTKYWSCGNNTIYRIVQGCFHSVCQRSENQSCIYRARHRADASSRFRSVGCNRRSSSSKTPIRVKVLRSLDNYALSYGSQIALANT